MSNGGWVGFDLDGTLAHYDVWRGENHVGEPVAPMVDLVKNYLAKGLEVRIVTARAGSNQGTVNAIKAWCQKHIGQELEVTDKKDYQMVLLYDDRCIQVERNTGRIICEGK